MILNEFRLLKDEGQFGVFVKVVEDENGYGGLDLFECPATETGLPNLDEMTGVDNPDQVFLDEVNRVLQTHFKCEDFYFSKESSESI